MSAGVPLSPISENTNSKHWHSTESLRNSRATTAEADHGAATMERRPSTATATASRPSTSGTERSRQGDRAGQFSMAEQPWLDLRVGAGSLVGPPRPQTGDLDTYMEDMLNKERSAFREQHKKLRSSEHTAKSVLRTSGTSRSSQQRFET